MARSKKGKPNGKGTVKPTSRTEFGPSPKTFIRASEGPEDNGGLTPKTFTMRDAARIEHSTPWSPATNLRHKAMSFVKSTESLHGQQDKQRQIPAPASTVDVEMDNGLPTGSFKDATTEETVDQAEESLPITQTDDALRPPESPTLSSSSEEVIVFTGRKDLSKKPLPSRNLAAGDTAPQETSAWDISIDPWTTQRKQGNLEHTDHKKCAEAVVQKQTAELHSPTGLPDHTQDDSRGETLTLSKKDERALSDLLDQAKIGTNKIPSAGTSCLKPDTNAGLLHQEGSKPHRKNEMLEDYIANMKENGMVDDPWETEETEGETPNANAETTNRWSRREIEDFGDLSTSDEVLDGISQVLSKRNRASGLQYLVVATGQSVDEARWIRQSDLDIKGSADKIAAFELNERRIASARATHLLLDKDDESSDSDDYTDNVEVGDRANADGEWEDEEEAEARLISKMDDEQIARLLSKQEELGMGSEELTIFDDLQYDEMDVRLTVPSSSSQPSNLKRRKNAREQKNGRRGQPRHLEEEDDEELFGNTNYEGFDVMDWERPSIGPKKGEPPDLDLSDSSLERTIHDSWSKDRQKKKARKQEREELRAQGLLGANKKSRSNVAARYQNGLPLHEFRKDLEEFLDDNRETMALPPMEKRERKLIHEVAAVFNCKSKSSGSGATRFPIIYKTRRTIDFDDDIFDRVEQKLSRRFFPTSASERKFRAKGAKVRKGDQGGRLNGGFNYREGETVGAGASEIGSENRGRAMLEKMGWSKGTALGALNNKGILMPIEHVVKTSRAGLG